MDSNSEPLSRRQELRHAVAADRDIDVVVTWSESGESATVMGKLHDVSRSGAKILLPRAVRPDSTVALRIQIAELDMDVSISATACWVQPASGEDWHLGCGFVAELASDVMPTLAAHGLLDRRQDTRAPASIPTLISQELHDRQTTEAQLEDYSPGGFRLVAAEPQLVNEGLLMELTDEQGQTVDLAGRVMWQTNNGDEFHVGCSFLNKEGYPALRRALGHETEPSPPTRRAREPALRMAPLVWAGMLAALLWCALRSFF